MFARATILILLVGAFAGCIETDEESAPVRRVRGAAQDSKPVSGHMTAHETSQQSVGLCATSSPSIQISQPPARYCGTRYHWIEGQLDLDELPLVLKTINGDVRLEFSGGAEWNLTIKATANNKETQEQARQTIDNLILEWSHEEDSGHFLRANARHKTSQCNNTCPSVFMTLRLPDNLFVRADLHSTNGDVVAGGHQYPSIIATSTNGNVVLEDSITRDVVLQTTNGGISVRSRPYEGGRWYLHTTNGEIEVQVPEASKHGYDVTADTTNGEVAITLQDGSVSGTTRTHKTFRTTDYGTRPIRTEVEAETTNGEIDVGPYTA